jgi:hypothetical protein
MQLFLSLGFLAVIGSASLIQTALELARGERAGAIELFRDTPTAAHLHAFEKSLEDSSVLIARLRPWMQLALFKLLADAGEKVVVGRAGWLFYRPGLRSATERPSGPASNDPVMDPYPAIKSFHEQLRERGIELVVLPVPNKESICPEMLSRRAEGAGVIKTPRTRGLLAALKTAGIEVVDLFEEFERAQQTKSPIDQSALYLVEDSHWSSEGMQLAVRAVARRILERGLLEKGTVEYELRPAPVERVGDLIEMLQLPRDIRAVAPERIACAQVIRQDTRVPYQDAPDARILILGDSFLRIYQDDEPASAGFSAHLALELKQPLSSIISDGGASTLVRQNLARRPRLLLHKRVVIWEFVERDIAEGTEGWQVIPLPKVPQERR